MTGRSISPAPESIGLGSISIFVDEKFLLFGVEFKSNNMCEIVLWGFCLVGRISFASDCDKV